MSPYLCASAVAVLLATTASVVVAQPVQAPRPAASAVAPGTITSAYRSAFDGYRPFSEQPLDSWREANDRVGQIGGWQAYAREGQGGLSAGSASDVKGTDAVPAMPGMQRDMPRMPGMSMPSSRAGVSAPKAPAPSSPTPAPASERPAIKSLKAPSAPAASSNGASAGAGRKTP